MLPAAAKSQAEIHTQRKKLTTSYNALLEEFSSKDLRAVGNYTLGHLIGKGSFGKVYLGTHNLTNGSKVVLKSTRKDDSNLAREVHHHRQFLHPHIARLYEVIVTESLVWLALEYCPGDELYTYLTSHGPIEPAKVQKIFTQLVGAVSYVHGKSCVHRDLKLENILLDKNGDVKLCDFGFTREYEGKSSYLQTWCGTVCYSAPEMLKGEKYAGEKVDVWSLGIILYALLCGELPFDEDDETVTKMKILKDEPRYPDAIPAPAKDLIQLILSKRPLLRPSLAEVLNHTWLAEHAPHQQAVLAIQMPPPFTTQVEKDTLQRMRNAGVNVDTVIENVLSQRCDPLAGWWAILLEKEQRKEIRRQRRRQERETDNRNARRISTASAQMNRLSHTLKGIDEEGLTAPGAARQLSDLDHQPREPERLVVPPSLIPSRSAPLTEVMSEPSPAMSAARIANGNAAAAKRKSQMNGAMISKRNSTLTLLATNPDFHGLNAYPPNQKRKRPFLTQLATIKSWFKDQSKRAKEPSSAITSSVASAQTEGQLQHRVITSSTVPNNLPFKPLTARVNVTTSTTPIEDTATLAGARRPELPIPKTSFSRPPLSTRTSTASSLGPSRGRHRNTSHSPAARPRRDVHLGSRKSTSSSISSVRSLSLHRASQSLSQHQHQHHSSLKHSHSKASSTSSTTSNTAFLSPPAPSTPNPRSRSPRQRPLSTFTGLKVLPPPPASPMFPSSIRIVPTGAPAAGAGAGAGAEDTSRFANYLSVAHGNPGPVSPGLPMFARGRRKVFKGPTFGAGAAAGAIPLVGAGNTLAERRRARRASAEGAAMGLGGGASVSAGASRSGSVAGGQGQGGPLTGVAEDEEEEEGEDAVEEVDAFSPVVAGQGVQVEIEILEDGGERGIVHAYSG